MYTTLLMSTGLTFGSISALFGLSHGIVSDAQYSFLIAAVIGSAVVPTLDRQCVLPAAASARIAGQGEAPAAAGATVTPCSPAIDGGQAMKHILVAYDGSASATRPSNSPWTWPASSAPTLAVLSVARPPEPPDEVETEAVIERAKEHFEQAFRAGSACARPGSAFAASSPSSSDIRRSRSSTTPRATASITS